MSLDEEVAAIVLRDGIATNVYRVQFPSQEIALLITTPEELLMGGRDEEVVRMVLAMLELESIEPAISHTIEEELLLSLVPTKWWESKTVLGQLSKIAGGSSGLAQTLSTAAIFRPGEGFVPFG